MIDDMLDLVLMILVLAIVTALSFTLIIPLTNSDIMAYNDALQDKGVLKDVRGPELEGVPLEVEEILYDARGVLLAIHVQDENMPQPRALRVGGNSIIPVSSAYKMEVIEIGNRIWNQLPSKNSLYAISYDYKDGGSYKIEVK